VSVLSDGFSRKSLIMICVHSLRYATAHSTPPHNVITLHIIYRYWACALRTGDPDKLQRAQGGGRIHDLALATGQEKADRILSRIRQKLRGDLSVEYTVNQLIMEARDTESLAGIFTGQSIRVYYGRN
jgi:hypothetical protein